MGRDTRRRGARLRQHACSNAVRCSSASASRPRWRVSAWADPPAQHRHRPRRHLVDAAAGVRPAASVQAGVRSRERLRQPRRRRRPQPPTHDADAVAGDGSAAERASSTMVDKPARARDALAAQVDEERRMREELQSLQRQVIRQERLAAIGVLVSGVAHELNNPLQAILGFAELLQMHEDLPPQARGRSDADPEGERPRQRHHPQPVALRPPADRPSRRRCGCATSSRRSSSCASGRLDESEIELEIERPTARPSCRGLHRAAAGRAELRHQRRAGGERAGCPAPDRDRSSDQSTVACGSRSRTPARACRPRTSRSCSSRSSPPSRSAGHRARPVGQLRHHPVARRDDRLPPARRRRRDVLLRAACCAERATRHDRSGSTTPSPIAPASTPPCCASSSRGAARRSCSIRPRSIRRRAASRSTPACSAGARARRHRSGRRRHRRTSSTGACRRGTRVAGDDRLAAPLRSHAAAHRPARAVGGVRSAVRRAHRELPPRERRPRRSTWRARCRRPRSRAAEDEANRIVWEDRPVAIRFATPRKRRRCRCARNRRAPGRCG